MNTGDISGPCLKHSSCRAWWLMPVIYELECCQLTMVTKPWDWSPSSRERGRGWRAVLGLPWGEDCNQSSIRMKHTERISTSLNFTPISWHGRQALKKKKGEVGCRPSRSASLSSRGLSWGPLCGSFSFIITIGFFLIFHSKPDRPDWQIHCLIFLVLDYMLFFQDIFIY